MRGWHDGFEFGEEGAMDGRVGGDVVGCVGEKMGPEMVIRVLGWELVALRGTRNIRGDRSAGDETRCFVLEAFFGALGFGELAGKDRVEDCFVLGIFV